MKILESKYPYQEVLSTGIKTRTFFESVDENELVWHRDQKNRCVKVIESNNWKLQMDNELPINLEKNKVYYIRAMQYHRIIKGNGNLILEIKEEEQ